jgi:type IV secretory pathway VirB2 component (pilin)
MLRKAEFFFFASIAAALMSLVTPSDFRWVAYVVAGTYLVFAALTMLEFLSNRSPKDG